MWTLYPYLKREHGSLGKKEGSAHRPWSVHETSRNRALMVTAAGPDHLLSLTLLSLRTAGTHSSSVMASWQLSQTLTSNSKPIRGMEERLELHLPQTAFPHLRQWCWREREHRLARAPATWPHLIGLGTAVRILVRMLNKSTEETEGTHQLCSLFGLFIQMENCWIHICLHHHTQLLPLPPNPGPALPILGPSQLWSV